MLLLPISFALAAAVAEPPSPATASLTVAEYAFADQSAKEGTRAAFLGALHKDGTVFIPRPVSGVAYYQTQLELGSSLQWFPVRVEASAAGDAGYSTGPWTYRVTKESPDAAYGWFVSFWEREDAGPWKVRLNIGISTPDPSDRPAPTPLPRIAAPLPGAPSAHPTASPELAGVDKAFGEAAGKDIMGAYKSRVDEHVRLYRKGRFPLEGPGSLQRYLDPWPVTFEPAETIISGSNDLGMVRGTLTRQEKDKPAQTSTYVHIWKKVGPAWKLALEVEVPSK